MKRRLFIISIAVSLLVLLFVTESCKKRAESIIRGRWTMVNMDIEATQNQIWDFYDNENLYIFSSNGIEMDTIICTYQMKSAKKLEVTISNGGGLKEYKIYKLNKRVLRMARLDGSVIAEFIEFAKN
ncbi:MAG: hypothetical protein V2A54_02550 [Bacteroidota bacterium]